MTVRSTMPKSSPPSDEPEIRPEVVQAMFGAMADDDSGRLNSLLREQTTERSCKR